MAHDITLRETLDTLITNTHLVMFGTFQVNFSKEKVSLDQNAHILPLERLLNEKWLPIVRKDYWRMYEQNFAMKHWNVPALMVRFDMPPISAENMFVLPDGDVIPAFYEIEGNPAGQGITGRMDESFIARVASNLVDLGIHRFGYGSAPSRIEQSGDLAVFMEALRKYGIDTATVDIVSGFVHSMPLWLRAGEEDRNLIAPYTEGCVLLYRDGGGHKGYLRQFAGAKLLVECKIAIIRQFPKGFALKPIRGWGSRDIEIWCPFPPYKRNASTFTRMETAIDSIMQRGRQYHYLVQPFVGPQIIEKKWFRIWRIFAMFTPTGYKIVGGYWNQRTTVKSHGASDAVVGPIVIA